MTGLLVTGYWVTGYWVTGLLGYWVAGFIDIRDRGEMPYKLHQDIAGL
jgi:hypothetical protein